MRLEPGYHVTPHVRLVRLLRKGGMGGVWAADHLALKTQVAVKFMSAALAQDEGMVTRFTREAAYAAQIKSPHVIHVYDHGYTEDGIPFIVMELLEGEDLAERVKRAGPLSLDEAARLVSQLCRALTKAHQIGIVHRDIKLNNVFLVEADGDIYVKLFDFGIAKQESGDGTNDVTTTGAMVGTLVYMSPEQLHNAKQVDFRTDLWSLAVVAYRAITGQLPFRDDDGIGALLLAVNGGIFPLPSELCPEVPPALDAWFQRAFRRNPNERFTSAREMAEEFNLAVGREPTLVPSSRTGSYPLVKVPNADKPTRVERAAARQADAPTGAGTAAGVPAQTLAGTFASPAAPRRRTRAVIGVLLGALAVGGTFVYLNRAAWIPARPAPDIVAGDPPAAAPPVIAPAPPPPEPAAAPAPASASASASAAASAAASASASASASAASAPPVRPGPGAGTGTGRKTPPNPPTKPKEKDYGF